MITVLVPAASAALTSVAAVRQELGLSSDRDADLAPKILEASAAVESYCGRTFAREKVQETVRGYGSTVLQVSRTPIVGTPEVILDNAPVVDFTIEDRAAGQLYRKTGWGWTRQTVWNLAPIEVPRSEDPSYFVTYQGGYFLPDDDYVAQTISVAAADRSFNDSAGGFAFAPRLVAGDFIAASLFAVSQNNGMFTVVSAMASKIVVQEALVDEAAPSPAADRAIAVRTLPADIERACKDTVIAYWRARGRDPNVASKRVGDLEISYRAGADPSVAQKYGLPYPVMGRLLPWVRHK